MPGPPRSPARREGASPTPSPSLAQLRALVAVADAGGFGEAAAELGVSQSTLSEAVSKLEDLTGRPLLRRGPAGTVPTPAGLRVLGHARAALQASADVLLAAQEPGALSGTLRIASYRSTATHLLPPALAAFRVRHPDVRIVLMDSESDACGGGDRAVQTGLADLAVLAVLAHDDTAKLHLTPLAQDEYVFVAPESRGLHPVQLPEIAEQPFYVPPAKDICHRRVRRYLEARGVPLHTLTENPQDSVILSMVAHGLGTTIMPRLALLPQPPGLITLPLPEPLLRPLALGVQPHRANLPVIRAFTEVLVQTLQRSAVQPVRAAADAHAAHLN